MHTLKRKIDFQRRQLEKLVIEFAKEMHERQHEWQKKTPDKIASSMEFIQKANAELFMADVALGD
jgi:hypothetical protein